MLGVAWPSKKYAIIAKGSSIDNYAYNLLYIFFSFIKTSGVVQKERFDQSEEIRETKYGIKTDVIGLFPHIPSPVTCLHFHENRDTDWSSYVDVIMFEM